MAARLRATGRPGFRGALFALGLVVAGGPVSAASPDGPVYRNPVIHADYSDPDALRADDGYYMTSSSFSHVPALPILFSRDLVHWELVNHAIDRLPPGDRFDTPRHGEGVWAPAFREHDGRFYIYYGDPDFGIYVVTADHPRGKWNEPRLIKAGKGLIDPAPFWDDDGRAWLVHAWAKSRAGFNNVLTLHRMSPDGLEIVDEGRVIVDGNTLEGWRTIEGPKLYRRDGLYYVFAPAGGVRNGWQGVFRSERIEGPYEERIVLAQGSTAVNGPHQGAWVTTSAGADWFLHFQDKDVYGRIVHLQPMRWVDGWPVMGDDTDGDGTGEPVLEHGIPHPGMTVPDVRPPTTDDFAAGFNLGWQWQANPQPSWLGDEAPGRLRLNAVPMPDNFWQAGNLLMQKFPAESFSAEVKVDLQATDGGDIAGLIVFGYDYAWIGLARDGDRVVLQQRVRTEAREGGAETILANESFGGEVVYLRVDVAPGGACSFSVRTDGSVYRSFGKPFTARQARWVGAKAGLFAGNLSADRPIAASGYADFSNWVVTVR